MRRQQDILRTVFLDGLALLSICMAILMMGFQISSTKSSEKKISYDGKGMALCHSEYTPGQDGWVTLEFIKFESVSPDIFLFTLKDQTTLEGNFPCVINFDRHLD